MGETDDEAEYQSFMPFVVCATNGGPHEDRPYVAGYRTGHMDATLEFQRPAIFEQYVSPEDVPQIDLIAMRRGYRMMTEPYDDEWTLLTLMLLDPPTEETP